MSDNVTGYGVPLTTKQRIARYGARTRPTITGRLPGFELDETLEPGYRESVILGYEDIDHKARKALSDAASWRLIQAIAVGLLAAAIYLLVAGMGTLIGGLAGVATASLAIILGFVYRRVELRRHQDCVHEAEEYLDGFISSGKARML